MIITKISPAVKTAGRYNIFIDDIYSFSLDELQLVHSGFKKGQEISEEQLDEYKLESDFGKNYIRAVDLISRRFRSEREIRDYSFRKQWDQDITQKVVDRLYKFGYLNDERFAETFIRSRALMRNNSKRKMILELRKKGVDQDIIDRALNSSDEYDEHVALKKMITKKRGSYDDERKLIAYLARQGFRYDDIKDALESPE